MASDRARPLSANERRRQEPRRGHWARTRDTDAGRRAQSDWSSRGASGMGDNISQDLKSGALFYHQYPRPGKLEIQPTKPLGNQRDLALAYSPGRRRPLRGHRRRSGAGRQPHLPPEPRRRDLQRHGRARPRRYRPARLQARDGGQGGPVQEVLRHRRVRHRGRREQRRQARRGDRGARADLRRHQSRGHQGAGMLRGRGAAEGPHGHPGLPRRPARHRDHRRRRGDERAGTRRQAHRGREDRHLGRRRRGARLPQPPGVARRQAREHLGHGHRGRRP